MSSTTNSTPTVAPSAPRYEETSKNVTMANFDTILNIRMTQWRAEQKLLTIGRSASQEEKEKLINTQCAELQELLRLCNVPKTRKVLLPIIWDTKEVDPIHQEVKKKIKHHLKKGIFIKPFKKGSAVDFNIWKDSLTFILTVIAETDYAFDIFNKICVQFIDKLIPHYSDAQKYMILIMPGFYDETGKIKFGTTFTAITEAILSKMRTSRTISITQMLAKKPYWNKNFDNVTKFIKKYESYLRQRLNINVVSNYLDNSEPLKKAEFLNFLDAIPPIIRREVRLDFNKNMTWTEFTDQFVKAEVMLAYNNPNYRINKSHKKDHHNKHFAKHNTKTNFVKSNNGNRFANSKQNIHKNNKTNYNQNFFNKNNGSNNTYENNNNRNNSNAKSTNDYQNKNKTYSKVSNFENNYKHNDNTGKNQITDIVDVAFIESLARKLHEQL
uniref:CRAL-TRIO domain-containing protein n=1 Tax=Strongyloides stercoralis TaxID=6248 RepID=A0A0K0E4M1_STRER